MNDNNNYALILANKAIDKIKANFKLEGWAATTAIVGCCVSICASVVLVKNGYPSSRVPMQYSYIEG